MKIPDMLNPLDSTPYSRDASPSESLTSQYRVNSPARSTPRQDRSQKDGFSEVKDKPTGDVKYPPYELCQDPKIGPELDKYNVKPDRTKGKIIEYPRYIPYASNKRTLQVRTGLKGLHVFKYEFSMQRDTNEPPKKHMVMWDYRIGLVRITPLFKALEYNKTTPKRAIDQNRGLEAITISLTGGSLTAQGYWMPFECARALAANFCHEIRYLLTPIFGPDFLDDCLPPGHQAFGKFQIDTAIIDKCAAEVEVIKARGGNLETPASAPSSPSQSPYPEEATMSTPCTPLLQRSLRSRTAKLSQESPHEDVARSEEQLYESNGTGDDSPPVSPKTIPPSFQANYDQCLGQQATPQVKFKPKSAGVLHSLPRGTTKAKLLIPEEQTTAACDPSYDPALLEKYAPEEIEGAKALVEFSKIAWVNDSPASDSTTNSVVPDASDATSPGNVVRFEVIESEGVREGSRALPKKRDAAVAFGGADESESRKKRSARPIGG